MAESVVHEYGEQQHNANNQARKISVKVCKINTLVDHRKSDCAKKYSDDRAKAAGQQNAPYDNSNDRIEYERHARGNLGRIEQNGLAQTNKGRAN